MKRVILISGKMGSGKTTLSGALKDALKDKLVARIKFADPLYQMHDAVLGLLASYGFTREIKKDGPLLQLLGTEWGRKHLGEDIWVMIAKNRADRLLKEADVVIFDDARFENELDAFPEALKIRLECPREIRKARCEMWRENDTHPSEIALDASIGKFDLVIYTGDEAREECVAQVLKALE